MQADATGDSECDTPAPWLFELVPLLELPEIDLSKSMQARLPRVRLLVRLVDLQAKYPTPFFIAYLAFLAIASGILFVDAPLGRALSVVAYALSVPPLAVCFSMLRYDLVMILIKTYDVWFFSVTSTLVTLAASAIFNDARSLLLLASWASFFVSIFVDANLFAIRNIWIASALSAACYAILACTIVLGAVDNLKHVNILNTNGHVLPATAIVRDGLITMVVLMLRNLARRYHHAIKKKQITIGTSVLVVRCVTFRCRLQLRELRAGPNEAAVSRQGIQRPFLPSATESIQQRAKTRLHFATFLGPIDARDSLFPIAWFWKLDPQRDSWWTRWGQHAFRIVGAAAFFIPNVIILESLLSRASANRTRMVAITAAAFSVSLVFVTVCLLTVHRRLLLALITSFDFIYIAFQGVMIHLTLADLCGWKPEIAVALASDLIWSTWMMCWDAVPPPARKRLGVTSGFAAFVGTGLVAIINFSACILVVVLPPGAINDRALFQVEVFGCRLEFFVLTLYLSCAATIVSWAIRIMWRLWRATETELVVLDGPVFFEKPLRSREARRSPSHRTSYAQVAAIPPNYASTAFPVGQ